MKKIIIMSLMMLVLVSQVFAGNGNSNQMTGGDGITTNCNTVSPDCKAQCEEELIESGNRLALQEANQERIQNRLSTALKNVENTQAKARLASNVAKFENQYQDRLKIMERIEFSEVDEETGAVKIKAKEQVKYFGFIDGTATKEFNINSEGNIEEKAPWYRFMYREVK